MVIKSLKRIGTVFLIITLLLTGVTGIGGGASQVTSNQTGGSLSQVVQGFTDAFTPLEVHAASKVVKAKVKKSTKKVKTYSISFAWKNEKVTATFKVKAKTPKKPYDVSGATLTLAGNNSSLSVPASIKQTASYKVGKKWYTKTITFKVTKVVATKDFKAMKSLDFTKAKYLDLTDMKDRYYLADLWRGSSLPRFQTFKYDGGVYCVSGGAGRELHHIEGKWHDEVLGQPVTFAHLRKAVLAGQITPELNKKLDKYEKKVFSSCLSLYNQFKQYQVDAAKYVHAVYDYADNGIIYDDGDTRLHLGASGSAFLDNVLANGRGACNEKSVIVEFFLDLADIPNLLIGDKFSVNHQWNIVKIGDDWYHLDATQGRFLVSQNEQGKSWVNFPYKQFFPTCTKNFLIDHPDYPLT
ncbi:MAG: hypothetical protein LBK50_03785 [Candidatus Nomurabacteria bacterium]|jgi:hypothetical protein|nr:hypothetical protein [Candidatus Nomurabacteria bacterium]